MGIGKLNELLRSKCRSVFVPRPLTQFSGKRIAIDANNWIYTTLSVAHRRVVDVTDVAVSDPDRSQILKLWLTSVMDSVCLWLTYGITPVFVFDGEYPEEKEETRRQRREKKQSLFSEIVKLKEELRSLDILSRTPEHINRLRSLMRQCFYLDPVELELLKSLLHGIGIPILRAKSEAEQLCASLCIEGKVTAVFSADTDTLIHGCPLLLTEFTETVISPETESKVHQVMTVSLRDVLQSLEIPFSTLVDLAIMAGCDYNESIKQLGIERAFKLMKTYRSIDYLPRVAGNPHLLDFKQTPCCLPETYKGEKLTYDLRVLKHETCRRLFAYCPSVKLLANEEREGQSLDFLLNVKNVLGERGRDILSQYNLIRYLSRLVLLYKNLPSPVSEMSRPPRQAKLVILPISEEVSV